MGQGAELYNHTHSSTRSRARSPRSTRGLLGERRVQEPACWGTAPPLAAIITSDSDLRGSVPRSPRSAPVPHGAASVPRLHPGRASVACGVIEFMGGQSVRRTEPHAPVRKRAAPERMPLPPRARAAAVHGSPPRHTRGGRLLQRSQREPRVPSYSTGRRPDPRTSRGAEEEIFQRIRATASTSRNKHSGCDVTVVTR